MPRQFAIALAIAVILPLLGCDPHRRATDGASLAGRSALEAVSHAESAAIDGTKAKAAFVQIASDAGKADGHAQRVIIAIDGREYQMAQAEAETIRQILGGVRETATTGHQAAARIESSAENARAAAVQAGVGVRQVETALPDLESKRGILSRIMGAIEVAGWTLLLLAALAVAAYIGLSSFIRPVFAAMGLIPRAIKEQAERAIHDIQASKSGGPPLTADRIREIENRRATDPQYDAAFDKLARAHKV